MEICKERAGSRGGKSDVCNRFTACLTCLFVGPVCCFYCYDLSALVYGREDVCLFDGQCMVCRLPVTTLGSLLIVVHEKTYTDTTTSQSSQPYKCTTRRPQNKVYTRQPQALDGHTDSRSPHLFGTSFCL